MTISKMDRSPKCCRGTLDPKHIILAGRYKSSTKVYKYICDMDLHAMVPIRQIEGIAFVFYYNEITWEKLEGVANVYIVSLVFNSTSYTIFHKQTFLPFPSSYPNTYLLSCFPSSTLCELLGIKEAVQ
jgi:hypothetical protein